MPYENRLPRLLTITVALITMLPPVSVAQYQDHNKLKEIIITAQKRQQSLQDTPIAISVLSNTQLEIQGINSLSALTDRALPSLRIQPLGNNPTTLIITLRGNGAADLGQTTREGVVATYLDGIYLGRAQGLGMELADLERIEVLRGPQGTLYGRNATGGAINLISKKPTGKFGIKQIIGVGRFDEMRSVTHINLPEVADISAKVDYLHSERDGWVNNTAPGEWDYNQYNNNAGRLSLSWQVSDATTVDYSFERSKLKTSQNYFQLYRDDFNLLGVEDGRQNRTRFPVSPLEPSVTDQRSHTLTLNWAISETLSFNSLTGYRELEEDVRNNWAGTLFFNGVVFAEDVEQEQFSQEFQLLGSNERLDWVAGVYYFDEDVRQDQTSIFTLDSFGCTTGIPNSPITPTTVYTTCDTNGVTSTPLPPRLVNADAKSTAVYGQVTWTPPILDDRLHITAGIRYTEDEKSGQRFEFALNTFDLDTDQTDPSIAIDYEWTNGVSTYAKWGTAHRAGGVSVRSASFRGYEEEEVETIEFGIKSEFWNRRARFNAALFSSDYDNMQIDFSDPNNISISETFNASETVEVDGVEIELTVTPLTGLVVGLSYTYLDGDMPPQPNPLSGGAGASQAFAISQTPKHAGSMAVDYAFSPLSIGDLTAHIDMFSTSSYASTPFGTPRLDAYTLLNGRLSLANIDPGHGSFKVSIWGKNLTDEEYAVFGFSLGDPAIAITQAFGAPRTIGIDVVYEF